MPSADEGVHCLPCHQIWGICTWPWVTHPWCLQWPTAPLKMDPMPITSSGAWEFVSDKMTSDCILSKSRCLSAVGNQQDLPETCLIPLGSLQWDGSHFEGAFPASRQCEWLFQAFWFHTESACHRIQATWHNRGRGGALSLPPPFRVSQSNSAPFCGPTLSLPWGINNHFAAQLLQAGIINENFK